MSDLLGAARSDAERHDREAMNLKMEIAHLRERLLLRVGGDASAAALEAENFALKASLQEAQEATAQAQQALQAVDAKYAKALRNLVKMDQAWKSSAAELQHARSETKAREATARQLADDLAQLKQASESDLAKQQTLVDYQQDRIKALEDSVQQKEARATTHLDQIHKLTLKVKELEGELEATRRRHESGKHQSVAKDDFDALQTRHQQAMEANATLRGEANALREERSSLQSQLNDTKASLTAAMAKFLQLKQDNATLEVRVAAANEKSEQCERDASFYKSEVDRVQSELTKRDEETLQLERSKQVLELKLSQQQRLAEDAVFERDQEARRLELKQELSWKDREFALEKEVRTLKQQCETLQTDAKTVSQLHEELRAMLRDEQDSTSSEDLKVLVSDVLAKRSDALSAAQHQQRQISRLQSELAAMKFLADENATLKADYEKTRAAMERIVGRKSKASANILRSASGGCRAGSSTTATPVTEGKPVTSSSFITQRRPPIDKENKVAVNATTSTNAAALCGTKRKLVLAHSAETGSLTPSKDVSNGTIFSPRSKRVVHVTSRYMQSTKSKR